MKTVFTARHLYTPTEEIADPLLIVEDGKITDASSRLGKSIPHDASVVDFGDATLAPGFFDVHMHGGTGIDLMRAMPSELPRLGKFLTTHGVTEYEVFGILSLMFWSLVLIVTVKYVLLVMRADNRGEGGILALTVLALRATAGRRNLWVLWAGLFGVALFTGTAC